jgi:hypothetical protein
MTKGCCLNGFLKAELWCSHSWRLGESLTAVDSKILALEAGYMRMNALSSLYVTAIIDGSANIVLKKADFLKI